MPGALVRLAVLMLAISVWLVATSADARHRKFKYYDYDFRYSGRQEQDPRQYQDDDRGRAREDERSGRGAFAAVIAELIRSCGAQAAELGNWPLDAITQVVRPDEGQRSALEELREVVGTTVDKLRSECPRDAPRPLAERLDELGHAVDTAIAALDTVRPVLAAFYSALDDEQKARLLLRGERGRDSSLRMTMAHRADGGRAPAPQASGAICERLASALRDWPIRRIERDVRLSDAQRVALYELATVSLKAADALACPAETALTPVGRLDTMRVRFAAVRRAVGSIRPALMRFYEALDQAQQQRFAQM